MTEKRHLILKNIVNHLIFDKVCHWLATGQSFSPVSSTNITEILLKVALNTIALTLDSGHTIQLTY
jgi:hypothetical protein